MANYPKELFRGHFYQCHTNIKTRCTNEKTRDYKNYGGRGIKCSWLKFEDFYKDMYESYLEHTKIHGSKNTTIDRINVNGNYCKENCKWATNKEQARNTRKTRYIEYNGISKLLVEWAEYFNINRSTLAQRYYTYKWDINKCLLYKK